MGKKSGPAAPPPPDPRATAQAQSQMNRETAIAQANLNRIDQVTPQGSITYNQIGMNSDGTPRFRQTQTFSPEQQALYDQQNQVAQSLGNLANSNISRVSDAQSKPFSYDGMSPMVTSVGQGLPSLQTGPNAPGVQRSVGNTGNIASGFNSGGPIQNQIGGAGDLTRGVDAGQLQGNFNTVGNTSRLSGNEGGNIQSGLDFSGTTALPGTSDFGDEARRVSGSVFDQAMSRLNPRFQQEESDMRSRLVNSGIPVGSEAFNREMDNFTRSKNDAVNQANFSAIQAGGDEQSRLFGLALGARQQGVGEATTAGSFANQAQAQGFNQALNTGGFNNAALGQQFGQNLTAAQFGNEVQNQRFGQGQQNAALNNTAQGQLFGQNAAQLQAFNQAQAQQFGQNQSQAQFGNAAQDQRFTQQLSQADLFNNAGNMAFAQGQSAAGMNNQARSQGFNEQLTGANLSNAARQQQIQEATYLRNLPLNEIAALLGTGGGVQNPQFQNVAQVGVAAPDYQGAVYKNFDAANAQYQAAQQARSQGLGSIFGLAGSLGAAAISDRRMKEKIVRVGELANGIPTYAFNYIGGKVRQFGVMAQDVVKVIPDAIGTFGDGTMFVDYRKVYA